MGKQKYGSNAWNRSLWENDLKSVGIHMPELQARFRPGNSVTVHYDPANPAVSALETEESDAKLALTVALLAAFIAVVVYRGGRNKAPTVAKETAPAAVS